MSIEEGIETKEGSRIEFEGGKFIELTEEVPGLFIITNQNFTEEFDDFVLTDSTDLPPEAVMHDEDSDLSQIYGRIYHVSMGAVEINVVDQDHMWIKAPSLDEAIAALRAAAPHGADPRDR